MDPVDACPLTTGIKQTTYSEDRIIHEAVGSPPAQPVTSSIDSDYTLPVHGQPDALIQAPDAEPLGSNTPGGQSSPPFTRDVAIDATRSRPTAVDDSIPQESERLDYTGQAFTGWAAVEKALSDFDTSEITAYKEDIDALLTFTGLYSAVLTAFVAISYPQLQEDTATETLQVLRLIAKQSAAYIILGGQLVNSTAVANFSSTPIPPSIAAVRINALWFASLVISLATASFSIFVKQWLAAYLAFSTGSPQGKLRVREYRRKGIEIWKVFEIASILPLLLQISLALFFAGLCIFTIDAHTGIGHTTLILVCLWAFFFITVTVGPIFSARCPYKTPSLLSITRALRLYVYPYFIITPLAMFSGVHKIAPILQVPTPKRIRVLIEFPFRIMRLQVVRLVRLTDHPQVVSLKQIFRQEVIRPIRDFQGVMKSLEEATIMRDGRKDWKILLSADTLQADDRLLETTIPVALDELQIVDWRTITDFLVQLIGNRVPLGLPELDKANVIEDPTPDSDATIVDSRQLSEQAKRSIFKILSHRVVKNLSMWRITVDKMDMRAAQWAACIFMATCDPDKTGSGTEELYSHAHAYILLLSQSGEDRSNDRDTGNEKQNAEDFGMRFGDTHAFAWIYALVYGRLTSGIPDPESENFERDMGEDLDHADVFTHALQLFAPFIYRMRNSESPLKDCIANAAVNRAMEEFKLVDHYRNLRPPSGSSLYRNTGAHLALAVYLHGIFDYYIGNTQEWELQQELTSVIKKLIQVGRPEVEIGEALLCITKTARFAYSGFIPRYAQYLHTGCNIANDNTFLAAAVQEASGMVINDLYDLDSEDLLRLTRLALELIAQEIGDSYLPSEPSTTNVATSEWRTAFNLIADVIFARKNTINLRIEDAGGVETLSLIWNCWKVIERIDHNALHEGGTDVRTVTIPEGDQSPISDYFCLILGESTEWQAVELEVCNRGAQIKSLAPEEKARIREEGDREVHEEKNRRTGA